MIDREAIITGMKIKKIFHVRIDKTMEKMLMIDSVIRMLLYILS
jgi:hypothetical protein